MSVARRLVSGSFASWVQILVTIAVNLAMVPLYLDHWSPSIYGVWLTTMALTVVFQIIDTGHQQYLGFEFLKIGAKSTESMSLILCSALPFAYAIGLLQILIIAALIQLGFFHLLVDIDDLVPLEVMNDAGNIVLLYAVAFAIFGSVGGILVRILSPLGYYARATWWGVIAILVMTLAPAMIVVYGGGFWEAGLAYVTSIVLFNLVMYFDLLKLLRDSGLSWQTPDIRLGAMNLWRSQVLVLTSLLTVLRTSGVRLVLAPIIGSADMAAFVTMRTGASVFQQGLSTITGPLMPELMKVLRERDQEKMEAAFATIWIILIVVMAPSVVTLQMIFEPLFALWTRGKMTFDPILFGLLSLSVLVFAYSQPAISVIAGNNLLRPQMRIATVAAVVVIGGICVFVPAVGFRGGAIAILAAELIAAYLFHGVASRWLVQHGLEWPLRSAVCAGIAVTIAGGGIAGLVIVPAAGWIVVALVLILLGGIFRCYWHSLPAYAKNQARTMLATLLPRKP